MTQSNEAKIAVLENRMDRVDARLAGIEGKLDAVLNTLAQITGGKRLLFTLAAIVAAMFGAGLAVLKTFTKLGGQ